MGHSAGRLFTHDHLAVTYDHVLELRDQLLEGMSEPSDPSASAFQLPTHAAVISGRLGDQFQYIVCNGQDDVPVLYVNSWDRRPKQCYPGILAWLRAHEAMAVEAIREGYFDRYPNGTSP